MGTYEHRQQCAASTNGCPSVLRYTSNSIKIDRAFLEQNGWWLDHGMWVCGLHEKKAK